VLRSAIIAGLFNALYSSLMAACAVREALAGNLVGRDMIVEAAPVVSGPNTLLRVRRRTTPRTDPLTVVGVDDWAFRRNRRYGTIVCDLERRRIVTLLPDREPATVRAWLADHPGIKIVSRDRGGGYGEAAAKALPDAVQVADRRHLMENASAAFLDAVRKSMRAIRSAIGSTTITPQLLTSAEKLRYESYLGAGYKT
jgi:transposase